MAITREKKKQLVEQYVSNLWHATNAVILQQNGINVSTATGVRKTVKAANGTYTVVRKRLFLRAIKEAGLPELQIDNLPGSVVVVTAWQDDQFGPLKAVNKVLKELKKDDAWSSYAFLGGWFDKIWHDGAYVNDLANLPSKEELISKLLFLLKYPMQSLASVVDQIAKKDWSSVSETPSTDSVAAPSEEPTVEVAKVEETTEIAQEPVAAPAETVAEASSSDSSTESAPASDTEVAA